jgi:MFS family permease
MVISSISLFGIDTLQHNGVFTESAKRVAGIAMASYAIFNGLGRIVWGYMSDHHGRQRVVVIMVAFQGVTMLSSYHLFVSFGHEVGLIIAASIIGFNFGGNFALMPAWTADLFGSKHFSGNYPWVFLAYGIAGIVGPLLAGFFKDLVQSSGHVIYWMAPYLIAGVLCFVGAYTAYRIKRPTSDASSMKTKLALEEHQLS